MYPVAVEKILAQKLDWASGQFRVCLMRSTYKFDPEDRVYGDVSSMSNGVCPDNISTSRSGTRGSAKPTFLLAAAEVKCDKVVVFQNAGEKTLVACSSIPAITPILGQRVDIDWPEDLVFDLYNR